MRAKKLRLLRLGRGVVDRYLSRRVRQHVGNVQQSIPNVYFPPRTNRRLLPQWHSGMLPAATKWLRGLPKPAGVSPHLARLCGNRVEHLPQPRDCRARGDRGHQRRGRPGICNVFTPPLVLRRSTGGADRLRGGRHARADAGGRTAAAADDLDPGHARRAAAIDRPGGHRGPRRGPGPAIHPPAGLPGDSRAAGAAPAPSAAVMRNCLLFTPCGLTSSSSLFSDITSNLLQCDVCRSPLIPLLHQR